MRAVADEKKIYGYVVYIRAYATADNQSYETGTLSVYYGGVKKHFLDMKLLSHTSQRQVQRKEGKPGRKCSHSLIIWDPDGDIRLVA